MTNPPTTPGEWIRLLRHLMYDDRSDIVETAGSIVGKIDAVLDDLDMPDTRDEHEASRLAFDQALQSVMKEWTPLERRDSQTEPSFYCGLELIQNYRPPVGWEKLIEIIRRHDLLAPESKDRILVQAMISAHSYYSVPPQDPLDRQSYGVLVSQLAQVTDDATVSDTCRAYAAAILVANGAIGQTGIIAFGPERLGLVIKRNISIDRVKDALRSMVSEAELIRCQIALDSITRIAVGPGNFGSPRLERERARYDQAKKQT